MELTRHQVPGGARWALDGRSLPASFHLGVILGLPASSVVDALKRLATDTPAGGRQLAPIEPAQEVWASGVTYLRSRDARVSESDVADVYDKVYEAERAELFFKANGWRVVADGEPIRVRPDSAWNVPEPELTLVVNHAGEVVGYTAGNDVSSRSIEGENPLYLPQAKIYNGSCALGPAIRIADAESLANTAIHMTITRGNETVYDDETSTAQMKRSLPELAELLVADLDFPDGAFLMTGAGIVPPDEFTLKVGDRVSIQVRGLSLHNIVGE